ncbi:MAG: hypothetical protein Q9190_001265 [Brigantiaea leucoxantha]
MLGTALGALACLSLVTYLLILPVVQYFRDPKGLRKYPTLSPLAGLTNIPFILESRRGFRSKKLLELHSQGLPVIRIGPNSLSYGEVSAIKDIYGHSTSVTKDAQYDVGAGSHHHLADVVDKKDHARKRKVLSSAFALKNLEAWEYKVADKIERLVSQFDKHCKLHGSEPIDYRAWTNFFTIDSLVDISLSERTSCLDNGNSSVTAEDLDGSTREVDFRDCLYSTFHGQGDLIWAYDWFKTLVSVTRINPFYHRIWENTAGWGGLVYHLCNKRFMRYKKGEKVDDLFQSLLEDKNGNALNLEYGEIVSEISLMISGSSSTSNGIGNVMSQLLENPECFRKLREEVDTVLDESDIVAPWDKVKNLPYLRACLDESLRMFPPISHGLPRETPAGGAQIRGEWIAGHTSVSMSAFVAHRDPKAFPEPEHFNPDRWLGEEGKQLQPYFIAFSAGARGCIGRPISYLQATMLLASIVHRYDLSLLHPEWRPSRRETMNLILGPLPVNISRREIMTEKN